MLVTQKCQYALRALFDLALRSSRNPVKIAEIAQAQEIPVRFLEIILGQLKRGGFVTSRRGADGGYMLARSPEEITVADVVTFVDGPLIETDSINTSIKGKAKHPPEVFDTIWHEARQAVQAVYEDVTIATLVEKERKRRLEFIPNYAI